MSDTYEIECGGKTYRGIPEDVYFFWRLIISKGIASQPFLEATISGGVRIDMMFHETQGVSVKASNREIVFDSMPERTVVVNGVAATLTREEIESIPQFIFLILEGDESGDVSGNEKDVNSLTRKLRDVLLALKDRG